MKKPEPTVPLSTRLSPEDWTWLHKKAEKEKKSIQATLADVFLAARQNG